MKSVHDNDVHFIIAGDFNKTDISEILHSYGSLKQICSIPTRNKYRVLRSYDGNHLNQRIPGGTDRTEGMARITGIN